MWNIVQLLISILLIIGGLTQKLVLRGTNSSIALVILGLIWLGIDIYQMSVAKKNKNEKGARTKRSKLFYAIFIIWIITELFGSAFIGSYGSGKTDDMLNWIVLCMGVTIIGVWMFLQNSHKLWLLVAIAGSIIPIVYEISIGGYIVDAYYYGVYGPRFSFPYFFIHLATNFLPGILLLLHVSFSSRKSNSINT